METDDPHVVEQNQQPYQDYQPADHYPAGTVPVSLAPFHAPLHPGVNAIMDPLVDVVFQLFVVIHD
jgi:hypothetical protein